MKSLILKKIHDNSLLWLFLMCINVAYIIHFTYVEGILTLSMYLAIMAYLESHEKSTLKFVCPQINDT